jgi:hypothetical protein
MSDIWRWMFCAALPALALAAPATLPCDMGEYREQAGLSAAVSGDALRANWLGARGAQLRAVFAIDNGAPVIREIAARKDGGEWVTLGRNLQPEFTVTAGVRRISEQQLEPLRALHRDITPEVVDREKWNVFWDAPLDIPGSRQIPGGPRRPEEIRHGKAAYNAAGCKVKTDGSRLEVSFPGLTLGIFSGRLQFTVYKGANLIRQEAIAKTGETSVAYKYEAGLRGFQTSAAPRVIWQDTARGLQKYEFGGSPNEGPVGLRARHRLLIVETAGGSLAVFPPPHKFFWSREIELNLGYVWYRKDDPGSFSIGVRQPDHEEGYRPYGYSNEVWERRVRESRGFRGNFALYNAPPGSWQRMAVYFYASPEDATATRNAVLAFTHEDHYKPLPGYQVAVSHFHTHFHEQESDAGSLDFQPPWIPTFRALGVNIAMMSDFHGDGHPGDAGPLRFREQHMYFEACRRHSDRDFLILPGEEPNAYFGGHYTMVFPRPVYWTHVRPEGKKFEEQDPQYGKVYHVGSRAEELDMLRREGGLVWQSHPRTKGSTGYPDASRETEAFRSDRFLGASYQSLPADLSQPRLCEVRCFGTLDDMNNWTGPKYLIAEGDTYAKDPGDETYPHLMVNYIKAGRLPRFEEDWSPVLQAMRAGDFFVTSGEILIHSAAVEGTGSRRVLAAEIEWTFPLDFVELVWGDGDKIDRQIMRATEMGPFGTHRFRIPFAASGKKWVRFAAWDSAGNGAFTQPVHLIPQKQAD